MRCLVHLALLSLAATAAPFAFASQIASADRLAAARAQLRATKLDSAALLVREALDATSHPPHEQQVEAWLLLGVIDFYKGDDSGTAADFRHALALEPHLKADGLAHYDSALVVLFNAQRPAAPVDTARPVRRIDAVVDCSRTCPEDVVLPVLIEFPSLEGPYPDDFDVDYGRHGKLTVQLIVDTAGRVAPGSVRVVASNLQIKALERALLGALPKARFTPGRSTQGPSVSLLVQGKLGFRLGRFEGELPVLPKRRPR
jgi:hypothetical protein